MKYLRGAMDCYIILMLIFFALFVILKNRKALIYTIVFSFFLGLAYIAKRFDLRMAKVFAEFYFNYAVIIYLVILAPEIRGAIDRIKKIDKSLPKNIVSSEETKNAIIEAVEFLASKKIGAIITLENHNSLDQYAERAIQMNCDISKELLINIFSPLTPLHDGAVIIKGDKIRCAGAYYVLTQADAEDKTMGSRHRAALGISENSDSITIIASEETGNVSIAYEGVMIPMENKGKLNEYLTMFLK